MKKLIFLLALAVSLSSCSKKVLINSISDLEGKTIGCQAGTTGESFLFNNFESIIVKSYRTGNDASLALKNKITDAVIIDYHAASQIVRENNDLILLDFDLEPEEYAIAVQKGNKELLDSINGTIVRIKSTRTYDMLINSFLPQNGIIVIPEVETLKTNEVIKMGTNAAFPPFEYTNGTEVVGFDATFAKYIANDCGKRLQIIDMAFNSLLDALQNGTIDFIAAGMTVNEERKALVDFSEPYFSTRQVIIVRK